MRVNTDPGIVKLVHRYEMDEVHGRLLNWGRWLRYDNTIARLGYPTQSPFVFSPHKGKVIADLDAVHIEFIISSMYISGDFSPLGMLYAFILRVEYAEHPDNRMPHVSQRAQDVRRKFKRPCAERTYYHHLEKAKLMVSALAGPLQ